MPTQEQLGEERIMNNSGITLGGGESVFRLVVLKEKFFKIEAALELLLLRTNLSPSTPNFFYSSD